jgi:hypothetical protein
MNKYATVKIKDSTLCKSGFDLTAAGVPNSDFNVPNSNAGVPNSKATRKNP